MTNKAHLSQDKPGFSKEDLPNEPKDGEIITDDYNNGNQWHYDAKRKTYIRDFVDSTE